MDRDVGKVKNIPLIQRSMSECYIKARSDFAPAFDITHVSQKVSNVFLMRCSMLLQFVFVHIGNFENFQRATDVCPTSRNFLRDRQFPAVVLLIL